MIAISDADQRTVSTDLLLALLEKVQRVRRDLRVVLVSTPTAAEPLRLYFAARTTHHAGASASPGAADCSPEPTVLPLQQESHPVQVRMQVLLLDRRGQGLAKEIGQHRCCEEHRQ